MTSLMTFKKNEMEVWNEKLPERLRWRPSVHLHVLESVGRTLRWHWVQVHTAWLCNKLLLKTQKIELYVIIEFQVKQNYIQCPNYLHQLCSTQAEHTVWNTISHNAMCLNWSYIPVWKLISLRSVKIIRIKLEMEWHGFLMADVNILEQGWRLKADACNSNLFHLKITHAAMKFTFI